MAWARRRAVLARSRVDLDYQEDSTAEVDMNVAMLSDGTYVEVQATGGQAAYTQDQLAAMLKLASAAIRRLHQLQRQCLAGR